MYSATSLPAIAALHLSHILQSEKWQVTLDDEALRAVTDSTSDMEPDEFLPDGDDLVAESSNADVLAEPVPSASRGMEN